VLYNGTVFSFQRIRRSDINWHLYQVTNFRLSDQLSTTQVHQTALSNTLAHKLSYIADNSRDACRAVSQQLHSVCSKFQLLGCVHIHTSTSPGTCIRVPVNTSLPVFQWWPFTLTQVLYEYELPVNFTRTSSFCTGRVFVQPVRCKQNKICINLICTRHYAYFTSLITSLFIGRGAQLVELLTI